MSFILTANWLTISNRALLLCGKTQISSFTDGSNEASVMQDLLPVAADYCFGQYNFDCNRKQAQLAVSGEIPKFGFDYFYVFPIDFCHLDEVTTEENGAWKLYRDGIYTDSPTLYITYFAYPSEPDDMNVAMRDLMVKYLAYISCMTLTHDSQLQASLQKDANSALSALMRGNGDMSGSADDTSQELYSNSHIMGGLE